VTDIVKDVQYALQESPSIQELVTSGLIGSGAGWVNGWIFDSDLSVRMENTQKCAIVVSYAGGHRALEPDSQTHIPLVVVDIWADPTREADNSVRVHDAKTKAFTVYDAVHKTLHLIDRGTSSGGAVFFDQTRIISSEVLGEPELNWVTDGNGTRMLRCRVGISY
jgi:hypothetical protein